MQDIGDPLMKRRDVAKTYALAVRGEQATGRREVDWAKVNAAIVARWSLSALNWIKQQAWSGKCFG